MSELPESRRVFFSNLGLTLAGTAVSLILAGALFAAWQALRHRPVKIVDRQRIAAKMDDDPKSIFRFDPDISYALKPNFTGRRYLSDNPLHVHRTDSRGLLGGEEIDPKSPARKVLFLGDSVAYGDGLDYNETFIQLMQRQAGDGYLLANASCSGWSTHQEVVYYRKHLSDIPWDAVVLAFCLNDLVQYEWVYASDRNFIQAPKDRSPLLAFRLWKLRRAFSRLPGTERLVRHYDASMQAWLEPVWSRFFQETLLPFIRDLGPTPLIVLMLPSYYQLVSLKMNASADKVLFPQERLGSFCRSRDIPFLDCIPPYLERISPQRLHYIDNLHFDRDGHRVLADFAWPRLERILEGLTAESPGQAGVPASTGEQ